MKLTINKNLLGKQTIKYHLLKYQIYLDYKISSENTQNLRTKHCVTQPDRIELQLKKSLMMIYYYSRNRNILLFIGLPTKWSKFFNNRFLRKKGNCFCLHINKKRLSKLTSDQFRSILHHQFINVDNKKSLLIVNFLENLDYKKISDIPVVNFYITNKFTLSLLGSSLSN